MFTIRSTRFRTALTALLLILCPLPARASPTEAAGTALSVLNTLANAARSASVRRKLLRFWEVSGRALTTCNSEAMGETLRLIQMINDAVGVANDAGFLSQQSALDALELRVLEFEDFVTNVCTGRLFTGFRREPTTRDLPGRILTRPGGGEVILIHPSFRYRSGESLKPSLIFEGGCVPRGTALRSDGCAPYLQGSEYRDVQSCLECVRVEATPGPNPVLVGKCQEKPDPTVRCQVILFATKRDYSPVHDYRESRADWIGRFSPTHRREYLDLLQPSDRDELIRHFTPRQRMDLLTPSQRNAWLRPATEPETNACIVRYTCNTHGSPVQFQTVNLGRVTYLEDCSTVGIGDQTIRERLVCGRNERYQLPLTPELVSASWERRRPPSQRCSCQADCLNGAPEAAEIAYTTAPFVFEIGDGQTCNEFAQPMANRLCPGRRAQLGDCAAEAFARHGAAVGGLGH